MNAPGTRARSGPPGCQRHHAYHELREPGAYFRVLATAARTQATRRAPEGSVSAEEMRSRIDARLAEAGLDKPGHP